MRCHDIKEKFPDFLIGDMDKETKDEIQSHLTTCPDCREELETLSFIWAKLGVLPEERPSHDLRTHFYSLLEAQKREREKEKPEPRRQILSPGWFERFWPRRPAFQFSLALVILLAGLAAGYFLNSVTQNARELAYLRQEVQNTQQMLAASLLDQQSPSERLKGINLSCRMEQPKEQTMVKLLSILNNDPNVNVRLAAVDALYLFHDYPMVKEGLTRSLSKQSSPLVQMALVDLMVEIRERRAAEALKQLTEEENLNPDVKTRAEQGLQQLSF